MIEIIKILAWAGMWSLGGWWLVRFCYHLRPNEELLAGVGAGVVLNTLAANVFGQLMPVELAFWLSAVVVFAIGLAAGLQSGWRSLLALPVIPAQWLSFGFLFLLFLSISRGLAIFDDFAHLPTTSMLAAGYLPPRFALDPTIPYDYHYFLLLTAAQLVRVINLDAWNALDVVRAFSFVLAMLLTFVWVQRLTGSKLAGLLGALMMAFATGTRWLLLILPHGLLEQVSAQVTLIGSGQQSGPDLITALFKTWTMEGDAPVKFQFAYANSLTSPGVLALLGPNSRIGRVIGLVLLLSFNHWRNNWAVLLSALLLSANGLLTEVGIPLTVASWGLVTGGYMLTNKTRRVPKTLWLWLLTIGLGTGLGMLQGGALHGMISGVASEAITGQEALSYQTVGFKFVFPPEIVSAHLGALSLLNPYQLLAALAEMGPILLVYPLAAAWAWKAFRVGRWYESVGIVAGLITLPAVFLEFTGSTGMRNTSRLYGFLGPCYSFAVPVVWRWAAHRADWVKISALLMAMIVMLGGVMMFSSELSAMSNPVASSWLTSMDVRASHDYWNKLEPGSLVFDHLPYRAPTVFGRPTNAGTTWYSYKPEWLALVEKPDVYNLRKYGFSYLYLDERYLKSLSPAAQKLLQQPCVQVMKEYRDEEKSFRRLVDIRSCQ